MEAVKGRDWTASGDSSAESTNNSGVGPTLALMLAVGPFAMVLGPGSGGMVTPATLQARSAWVSQDSTNAEVKSTSIRLPSADTAAVSLQQRLEALKVTLGLTVTDMAELFGGARPSIYAWLKGNEPRPDNVERLPEFENAATQVAGLDLPRVDKLVKRPLKSGDSLFLLIKQGMSLDAALAELAETGATEAEQRGTEKGRYDLASAREVADDYSVKAVRKDS